MVGEAINIIQAAGLPPGKMSVFIRIRIAAAILPAGKAISAEYRYRATASCFWGDWWVIFGEQTWVIPREPRGTPEKRPMRDTSKPANGIRQD